jgi:hypothetical protein
MVWGAGIYYLTDRYLESECGVEVSADHLKLLGSGERFGWRTQLDLGSHLFPHLQLA